MPEEAVLRGSDGNLPRPSLNLHSPITISNSSIHLYSSVVQCIIHRRYHHPTILDAAQYLILR